MKTPLNIQAKILFAVGALALLAAAPVQADELASHRAAYQIRLAEARDGVAITHVSGQIAYGVEKVCDGWLLAQTGTMNLHLPTGDVAPQTLHYSSWEADDATRYRFSVTADGVSSEVILGTAEIRPGAAGQANFTRPEAIDFTLPKDTLFPVSHTYFLIERARAGVDQAQSYIFEGTEVGGVKLLVAFISPLSAEAKATIAKVGGDLLGRPGWNFRLAYFDPQSQTGEPMYEVEADMLDNGVAARWVLDYGAYAVEMNLDKIEPLAKPDC